MKSKFSLCVLELPKDFKIQLGEVHEKLSAKKFVELSPSQESGCGWVNPEDIFKTNFAIEDIVAAESIICGFRFDKKSVPGPLVKKLFRERLKEREKELGAKLEKAEKQLLKEECKEQLLLKALPSPKMVQWIWNMVDNRIYLDMKSEKSIDDFIELFCKTFEGVTVQRKNYGIPEDNVTLFLDWLWKQSTGPDGQWFDKGITLDADSNIFKFNGPTLEAFLDQIEAMKEGKSVKEICIGCALCGNDYYITFNSKNLIVTVDNTNKIKYESTEAAVLDREDISSKVVEKIENLITEYLK